MTDYPHVRAAFINAIAEEGTKAEAIEWLQKQWNENCALRKQLADATPVAPRKISTGDINTLKRLAKILDGGSAGGAVRRVIRAISD